MTKSNIKYIKGALTFTVTGVVGGSDTYDNAGHHVNFVEIYPPPP